MRAALLLLVLALAACEQPKSACVERPDVLSQPSTDLPCELLPPGLTLAK
jgi:hypothetical protein